MNEKLKNLMMVEKYRPSTIDECILPESIKKDFRGFVSKGSIPNLLLAGSPGLGKTSIAIALCEELGCEYLLVNGSLDVNRDALRNDIASFASTVSIFKPGRKCVIIDEADYLASGTTQPALRGFTEEFAKNCSFILTCNYKNRLIEPLRDSRFANVDFVFSNDEMNKMKIEFAKRLLWILDEEKVEYDKKVISELIRKHFPDMRRILNEIERYSASGKIDSGILVSVLDSNFDMLVKFLKDKEFNSMRRWVAENAALDTPTLIRKLYDKMDGVMTTSSIPQAILLCDEYQYKASFVADQEINIAAFLTRVMVDVEFL
jgi:DNA polymerase III delta prime subunit